MKRVSKFLTVVAATATAMVGVTMPASASHYQGGEYSYCSYPTNNAYDGVYISTWGIGSDKPRRNLTIAAKAWVGVERDNPCYRKGAIYHVEKVAIENVAILMDGKHYRKSGRIYTGRNYATGRSGQATTPCGKYVQSAVRVTVKYSNGAKSSIYSKSAGFKRC